MATPTGEAAAHGSLLSDPTTWVAVAFVLFVVVIVWKVLPKLLGNLDQRGERIASQLDEARRLREEAENLLADYQRQQAQAMTEAKEILAAAKREAEALEVKSKTNLDALLARREKSAMDKLAQAEANALQEVKSQAVAYAVAATQQLLAKKVTAKTDGELVDSAIGQITTRLQ